MHSALKINSFLKGSEIIKHTQSKEATEESHTILGEVGRWQEQLFVSNNLPETKNFEVSMCILLLRLVVPQNSK